MAQSVYQMPVIYPNNLKMQDIERLPKGEFTRPSYCVTAP